MDCEHVLNLISAEIDGEIEEPDRIELTTHLADCPICRETHDQMREQDSELRRTFGPLRDKALSVSSYVESRLPEVKRSDPRPARGRLLELSAAAAAGFLIAALVFQPWRSPEAPPTVSEVEQTLPEVEQTLPSMQSDAAHLNVAAGTIEILSPGTDTWTELERGDTIVQGAHVRTNTVSRCELSTTDGSTVRLNRNTVLVVQNHREFMLDRGQVWADVVQGETPFRVDVPSAGTTVTAVGTQFDILAEFNEALVTVVEGSTRLEGLDSEAVLKQGEVARVVDGRLVERHRASDLVMATRWVHKLLVLKNRDDGELNARVGELFARIGKTKVSYLLEDEIRSLGDHCVLPLRSYLLSADSRQEPKKRALAARILSDVTQPWFVPEFIDLLKDEDGEVRYYAATGLERLTQRNFGTSAEAWRDDPANERAQHHARWRTWWDEKRTDYPGGPVRPPPPRMKARSLK